MTASTDGGDLAGRRILVVEDLYFIADDVARALRKAGATVVGPAPDRERAMSLLASEAVDAAVLDINLKGDTAYALADLLRAQGTPFVFATGYDRDTIPAAYRDVARLEKPFDLRMLTKMLPALLAQA